MNTLKKNLIDFMKCLEINYKEEKHEEILSSMKSMEELIIEASKNEKSKFKEKDELLEIIQSTHKRIISGNLRVFELFRKPEFVIDDAFREMCKKIAA